MTASGIRLRRKFERPNGNGSFKFCIFYLSFQKINFSNFLLQIIFLIKIGTFGPSPLRRSSYYALAVIELAESVAREMANKR
jgi:hypothetical protein